MTEAATYLTTTQAAKMCGMGRITLTKMIDAGALPAIRPTSRRMVALTDVEAFMERARVKPRQNKSPTPVKD